MANEFKIKNGLVVSGSADVEQNLTVNGILTAKQYNVSLISSSILFESGSTQLGNSLDDTHLFTGSIKVTGSITLNGQPIGTGKLDETTFQNYTSSTDSRLGLLENSTGSIRNDFNSFTSSYTNVSGSLDSRLDTLETLSGSFTGSFSGSFVGDGTNLFNIPASGVTGLNLTQIADGSVTASVSNTNGLRVNSKSEITGSLIVTNGITGSIDYSNITNKPTLVSGSVQIEITGTTGYSTFSSSISSSIGSLSSSLDLLSSSIATTDSNQNTRLGLIETSTGSLNTFTSSALTRLGLIETSTGSLNSFTSSALTRVSAIETSTGSLNLFTSSIDTTIKTKLNSENVISGSIQVNITGTTGYSTFSSSISSSIGSLSSSVATTTNNLSSSIATTDLNQSNRIGNLEVSTGSLNSFTSSIDTTIKNKLNSDGVISGSSQVTLSATTGYSDFSSSIATTDLNQSNRLNSIETSTGSLNSFTSSIDTTIKTKLNAENVLSGSSQVLLSSGVWSGSAQLPSGIVSGSSQLPSGLVSGSSQILNGTTIHSGTFFNGITVVSGSSQISYTGITDIPSGLVSGSSQVLSGTGIWSGSAQLPNGVVSGSSQVDITGTTNYTSFSSSIATTDLNQSNRLDSIETKTGSYATTGSNVFKSNQTISGSVIITENLTVFGSSSITYVTSSQLRVDDNIITVNTASPGSRFGGLEVHDSGSVGIATGSLLWDSVNNRWVYQNSSEASYGGGVLLSGPRSSGSLGSELTLTSGRVAKSAGGDHLNDSNITDNGTTVSINSNTQITGSLIVTGGEGNKISVFGPGGDEGGEILLGKAATNTTLNGSGVNIDIYQNKLRFWEDGSPNRGAYLDISTLGSGVSTNLLGTVATASYVEYSNVANKPTLVSGSSQISFNGITDKPTLVSGSSQVLNGSGVWSGSAQLPAGTVSGSSQVLSGTGIWSGSAQLPAGVVSGSSQITYSGISGIPSGIISGSSQVSFGSISGVPSGLVSGSSQVLLGSGVWSGSAQLPSGVVSGSSQVLSGTGIWSGSAQLPSGVVSGSAQTIANLPSGTVSGSSQITLTSGQVTTGLGYTPYNSTNPSGYISSYSETDTLSSVTARGNTTTTSISATNFQNTYQTLSLNNIKVPGLYNYDGGISGTQPLGSEWYNIRTIEIGADSRYSQFVMPYNVDRIFYRRKSDAGFAAYVELWHSGNLTNNNQLTNGAGYITGINSSAVTTALGFTPYNATNPSGYISSITSGNVTTALGYTPYNATNPNGYISSITSGNVTTALGYTPYNATNPNGYITSAGSISGTASNITAYTINQSVGTSNTPTFAGLIVGGPVYQGASNQGIISLLSDVNVSQTNNYFRLYVPQGYVGYTQNGGVATIRVVWGQGHAGITYSQEYKLTFGTNHGASGGYLVVSDVTRTYKDQNPDSYGGYVMDQTPAVDFFQDISGGYINFNVKGYHGQNTHRVVSIDITGGSVSTPVLTYYGASSPGGTALTVKDIPYATTAGALTSMNISQFTNNSSYITGISFANVSSKPTTISGYGITDAITTGNIGSQSVNYANTAGNITAYTINQSVGTSNSPTFAGITVNGTVVASQSGFQSATYASGRNRIWSFGNADAYGLSYFQGSGGYGGSQDMIGFHFGTASVAGSKFTFVTDGRFIISGDILPSANNTYNLGSASLGWANVYTNDLHLSNMNKPEGNDVDGTKGTWTIQEGAENLYIINNNNGKKFKINLEEII